MRKSIVFLAGVIFLGGFAGTAFAQDRDQDKSQDKSKAKVRTVTGCLTKAPGGDEYLLAARNGSTWEVHSNDNTKDNTYDNKDNRVYNRVSFADHVGQTVIATGVVSHSAIHNMKENVKDTAAATGVKKDNREHGHLVVTSLKMVSVSCSSHRHTDD